MKNVTCKTCPFAVYSPETIRWGLNKKICTETGENVIDCALCDSRPFSCPYEVEDVED